MNGRYRHVRECGRKDKEGGMLAGNPEKKNDNEAVTALTFSEHSHKLDTWAELKMAIKFKIEVTVVFLVLYPFSTYE